MAIEEDFKTDTRNRLNRLESRQDGLHARVDSIENKSVAKDAHEALRTRVEKIEGKTNLASYILTGAALLLGATFEKVWNFLTGHN